MLDDPRIMVLTAGFCAIAGLATALLDSDDPAPVKPAPVVTAELAEPVLVKSDRLPLAPIVSIADRWYQPAPPESSAELLETAEDVTPPPIRSKKLTRHEDPVCGSRGRRITHNGRSWRCRR